MTSFPALVRAKYAVGLWQIGSMRLLGELREGLAMASVYTTALLNRNGLRLGVRGNRTWLVEARLEPRIPASVRSKLRRDS